MMDFHSYHSLRTLAWKLWCVPYNSSAHGWAYYLCSLPWLLVRLLQTFSPCATAWHPLCEAHMCMLHMLHPLAQPEAFKQVLPLHVAKKICLFSNFDTKVKPPAWHHNLPLRCHITVVQPQDPQKSTLRNKILHLLWIMGRAQEVTVCWTSAKSTFEHDSKHPAVHSPRKMCPFYNSDDQQMLTLAHHLPVMVQLE